MASTASYTMPRASQMATRTLITPGSDEKLTLHRLPTNNYEEAKAAAAAANQSLTADTTGPSSPNATKADLKRCQHEELFGKVESGSAGYFSTGA